MTKILITEFINQNSLENLNKKFDVNYDEKLCEDGKEIIKIIFVKNRLINILVNE